MREQNLGALPNWPTQLECWLVEAIDLLHVTFNQVASEMNISGGYETTTNTT